MNYSELRALETIAEELTIMGECDAAVEHFTFIADNSISTSQSLRLRQLIQDIKRKQMKERHGL